MRELPSQGGKVTEKEQWVQMASEESQQRKGKILYP